MFTLDPNGWAGLGGELAVLVPRPTSEAARLQTTDYVTIVGTVRTFVRAELERDYDWFDDIPDMRIDLEGRPVVVADVARTSDGTMLAQQSVSPPTRVFVAAPAGIADMPGRFFGRAVAVINEEVEDVWSSRVFTLDEDRLFAGPDVLVFNPYPTAGLDVGSLDNQRVSVFGVVRPFLISEFETEYDWFDAADYKAFDLVGFERRPVIVASSITRADSQQELVQFQPPLALDRAEAAVKARQQRWANLYGRTPPTSTPSAGPSERAADRPTEQATGTSGQSARPPLRDVSAMLVAGRDDVIGRRVVLDRVQVLDVLDPQTFVVGPSRVHTVAVRLMQAAQTPIRQEQYVRIEGVVRRTPADAAWNTPLFVDAQAYSIVD